MNNTSLAFIDLVNTGNNKWFQDGLHTLAGMLLKLTVSCHLIKLLKFRFYEWRRKKSFHSCFSFFNIFEFEWNVDDFCLPVYNFHHHRNLKKNLRYKTNKIKRPFFLSNVNHSRQSREIMRPKHLSFITSGTTVSTCCVGNKWPSWAVAGWGCHSLGVRYCARNSPSVQVTSEELSTMWTLLWFLGQFLVLYKCWSRWLDMRVILCICVLFFLMFTFFGKNMFIAWWVCDAFCP